VPIYGGFAGDEEFIDERRLDLYETELSGDLDSDDIDMMPDSGNVFHVVTGANGAVLDGFTISGGYADGYAAYGGGGMLNDSVSPTINNCTFIFNAARDTRYGGAVHNRGTAAPTFTNCLISGNMAVGYQTGGIYHEGGELTLINCTVANNIGDGIHCAGTSTMTMDNCIVWQNRHEPNEPLSPIREIVLQDSAVATIDFSTVEGGKTRLSRGERQTLSGVRTISPPIRTLCNGVAGTGIWPTAPQFRMEQTQLYCRPLEKK